MAKTKKTQQKAKTAFNADILAVTKAVVVDEHKESEGRQTYWNTVNKSTLPTIAGNIGLVLLVVPYLIYRSLPADLFSISGPIDRITVLINLQIIPAFIFLFYFILVRTLSRLYNRPVSRDQPLPRLQRTTQLQSGSWEVCLLNISPRIEPLQTRSSNI
jgi:hypothetical protein